MNCLSSDTAWWLKKEKQKRFTENTGFKSVYVSEMNCILVLVLKIENKYVSVW